MLYVHDLYVHQNCNIPYIVQLKGKSITEVRAGLKAFGIAVKDCYDKNRDRMEGGLATSAYNLSLSLPCMCHLTGWLVEWNTHVVDITSRVEEVVTRGMTKSGHRNAGLQSMLDAME
jgi:hypothetical protein